eukprot:TRINITY_DN12122_c0_g2_i1.p1 TRINITY_DN12122_c0_g2~~TRINITY_DN12122_c0_g2_i1.p1  ORF type:complete len:448 (-),score=78.03 TRINITY_DN12122_c0_g2_i1:117-1412(-)
MAHQSRARRFLQFVTGRLQPTPNADSTIANSNATTTLPTTNPVRRSFVIPSWMKPNNRIFLRPWTPTTGDRLPIRYKQQALEWVQRDMSSDSLANSLVVGKWNVRVDGVSRGFRFRNMVVHGVRSQRDLIATMSLDSKKSFCKGLRPLNSASDRAALKSILTNTQGTELTDLKLFLDGMTSDASLGDVLMSYHLSDAMDIMEHISDQCKPASSIVRRKIMSDIDDTIVCNLLDHRYPSGTVYPGVLPFYTSLSPEGLVFLTARPRGARRMTLRGLEKHGLDMDRTTVVFGSLLKLVSNSAMAERKFQSFSLYRRLYPEFSWVFIGDSGQGDLDLCKTIISDHSSKAQKPELILIHDIVNRQMQHKIDHATRKALARDGIVVFDTYITPARLACAKDIITSEQAAQIIQSVVDHHQLKGTKPVDEKRAALNS